ncbi:MAG: histidinol-phosphatase [Candidatus Marinimicrobia bacterium]|nr:histidinol-phosphatase [Candidatus Neomarinimicrobiota bacterium]
MKKKVPGIFLPILLVTGILLLSGCDKPGRSSQWYKGNLHTHSYWSDGDDYPEMIMDWYKSHGYDFVALSDHNILAEGEKWKLIPKHAIHQQGFREYLDKFSADWVEYNRDSVGLQVRLKTLTEYRQLFEEADKFLIIPAEEITTSFDKKPLHLNAINVQRLIQPRPGNSVVEVLQNNIDAVLSQRDSTGEPILPHINHPNYHYAITVNDFIQLRGERFFEVYNGHPLVNNFGDSLHISTEQMWDAINITYARNGRPLLYGLATDDSHNYHQFGQGHINPGRGWVMVNSDLLTTSALIAALEAGRFYASTGVTLKTVELQDNILLIAIASGPGIDYSIQFIGATKVDQATSVLQSTTGISARFKVDSDLLFVRAKITSSKIKANPHQVGEYEVAWTQPVVFQIQ